MNAVEAHAIIGDAKEKLLDAVLSGFSDYITECGEQSHKHHPRTRACLVHDLIVGRAKELQNELSGFVFIRRKPRNFFNFREQAIIQFKKLKPSLLTANLQTSLALALEESPQISIPGIPPKLPLITVGYVPNQIFSAVDGVFITYVENKELKWHIPLVGETDDLLIMPNEQEQHDRKRVYAKGYRQQRDTAAAAGAV